MAKTQFLTVQEVANILGCTHGRVCQILRENKGIGMKPGRDYLLTKSDIPRIRRHLGYKGKKIQKSA